MRLPSHPIGNLPLSPYSSHPDAVAHAAPSRPASVVLETSLPGSLCVVPLDIAQLPALHALRERVLNNLSDPDYYRREPDEMRFLQDHVQAPHLALGVKEHPADHARLIAYAMLDFPRTGMNRTMGGSRTIRGNAMNGAFGRFGGDNAYETYADDEIQAMCNTTPQLISCMVDADFRGQGLQRYLIKARVDAGRQRGAKRFWAMVAPGNHVSRDNLSAAGFQYLATREIDGHARHIMMLICHGHHPA